MIRHVVQQTGLTKRAVCALEQGPHRCSMSASASRDQNRMHSPLAAAVVAWKRMTALPDDAASKLTQADGASAGAELVWWSCVVTDARSQQDAVGGQTGIAEHVCAIDPTTAERTEIVCTALSSLVDAASAALAPRRPRAAFAFLPLAGAGALRRFLVCSRGGTSSW